MAEGEIQACDACGARVIDPSQRTCPNCLAPLSTRTFGSQADLRAYQEDRAAHGAPVPDERQTGGRPGLALALAFAAFLMLLAGSGLLVGAAMGGSPVSWSTAVAQAAVPLAMGAGLIQVARKYGGWNG